MEQNRENQVHEPEHETHIPALVFLVLVTVAVVAVVAVYSQPQPQPERSNSTQATEQTKEREAVTYLRTQPVDTTDDLPSGLMFGNAEIVQNRSLKLGSRQQRILVYDTEIAPEELRSQYQSWLTENGYEITSESFKGAGGSFVASSKSSDNELIVVFNQRGNPSGARVQFNVIAQAQ